jgi:hypothetical protein
VQKIDFIATGLPIMLSLPQQRLTLDSIEDYTSRNNRLSGLVSRMPSNSKPQMAMLQRHNGYKARGRPRKRWTSKITEALNYNIHIAHTKTRSRDLLLPLTLKGT